VVEAPTARRELRPAPASGAERDFRDALARQQACSGNEPADGVDVEGLCSGSRARPVEELLW